jgi:hypothetical protein
MDRLGAAGAVSLCLPPVGFAPAGGLYRSPSKDKKKRGRHKTPALLTRQMLKVLLRWFLPRFFPTAAASLDFSFDVVNERVCEQDKTWSSRRIKKGRSACRCRAQPTARLGFGCRSI